MSLGEWHQVMDTNLTATFLACKAVGPHMKRAGFGRVIDVRVDPFQLRVGRADPVLLEQGRRFATHPRAGSGVGQRRHHGQRDLSPAFSPQSSTPPSSKTPKPTSASVPRSPSAALANPMRSKPPRSFWPLPPPTM